MVRIDNLPLYFLLLSSFLFYFACEKDDVFVEVESDLRTFPEVDERLWPFFESFELEAAERGVEVDLREAGISGKIRPIAEEHVAGRCSYIPNIISSGNVTVDAEFWDNSSSIFKEFIVFHELGHCYLNRDHREDADAQGACISLMRSGLGTCRDNYTSLSRKQYIDELFDPDSF